MVSASGPGTSISAGSILSHNGGTVVGGNGASITAANAGLFVAGAGGSLIAGPGGSLVAAGGMNARNGGIIGGSGSISGPGLINPGGSLRPGMSPGLLTWTGSLNIENGSDLEIELAGTTAGTQYDVLNVSGALILDGVLKIKLLSGFQNSMLVTDVFNVATAGSAITGTLDNLSGGRVSTVDGFGSFAVQFTNSGKTLTLTDFQPAGTSFASWAAQKGLTGNDALHTADPDFDGLNNLLEYALGLDPSSASGNPTKAGTVDVAGQLYLTLTYTRPAGADARPDITYTGERSTTLAPLDWSSSGVIQHSVTLEPGGLIETVILRSTFPSGAGEFLQLKVSM